MADYNRCDYTSLEDLARDVMMTRPSKLFAPSREAIDEFLKVIEQEFGGTFDDFWTLNVGAPGAWEDYSNTPTRTSIEMGEIIDGFFEATKGKL